MFGEEPIIYPYCKERSKIVDYLATQCDRMLYHNYTQRYNKVIRCLHLNFCTKYRIKAHSSMRSYLVQEIIANENVKIQVDTRVQTAIKVDAN
ncbi:hypothetical protein PAEPH01_2009 [Pancytospora epiphaga]|nr:hypothetical protein PAEPH01_2009 [Pancytospora epiphaga]